MIQLSNQTTEKQKPRSKRKEKILRNKKGI
jgi:hypothetical protein